MQALHGSIEERAEDLRTRELELPPERLLRPPLRLTDRAQGDEDGTIAEIGAGDDLLDAVEHYRPGGGEQHLILIGVELTDREGAAAREPTERVR